MAVLICHLCGRPAESPLWADASDALAFCCHGCRELWRLLGEERLAELQARPGVNWAGLADALATRAPAAARAMATGETEAVTLGLEGLWCASCAALITHVLARQPGVVAVHVDYAAEQAEVAVDTTLTPRAELERVVAELGYGARVRDRGASASQVETDLLHRFGLAVVLAVLVMMGSVPIWSGYLPTFPPVLRDVLAAGLWTLATPVLFWCGWPFLRGAWQAVRHGLPTADLLVATGSVAAYAYSVEATLSGGRYLYFDTASLLVAFLLLGRCLELATRNRATSVIRLLLEAVAHDAVVLREGREVAVAVSEVAVGDTVVVRPGQKVPVDGEVVDGRSTVDESVLTGESLPVDKGAGQTAYAGTLNQWGRLVLRARRTGDDTVLGQSVRAVQEALRRRGPWQRLADVLVRGFVPAILLLAAGTFASDVWLAHLATGTALLRAIAVLVIACPCGLAVATPLAVVAGAQLVGRRGVLLRSGDALERAANIDTVLLDKTGTLTTGRMWLVDIVPADMGLLALAASVEVASEHPVALAVVRAAEERALHLAPVEGFEALPGQGVRGRVDGRLVEVAALGPGDGAGGADAAGTAGHRDMGGSGGTGGAGGGGAEGTGGAGGGGHGGTGGSGGDGGHGDTGGSGGDGSTRGHGSIGGHGGTGGTGNWTAGPDQASGGLDAPVGLLDGDLAAAAAGWRREGRTGVSVRVDGQMRGVLAVSDRPRPESREAVDALRRDGLDVWLVTGDAEGPAELVADALGISRWAARRNPADKAALVAELQAQGRRVAFLGDGVNDAPALVRADLGVALATGADVAVEAGHLTLVRPDPRGLAEVLRVGRRTVGVVRQNMVWAFGYNLLAVPAAVAGLAQPAFAAGAMVFSSSCVLANSLRLLGRSPRRWIGGLGAALGFVTLLAALAWWGV